MYLFLFISHTILCYSIVSASFVPSRSSASAHSNDRILHGHTLRDGYPFDVKDGWQFVNITGTGGQGIDDVILNYTRGIQEREAKSSLSVGDTVSHLVDATWNDLKGLGMAEDVTITWYTGQDLLNPSCWAKTDWAPTDDSFACAVTLHGWTTRPSCFKFLEICNTHKNCVFVRVVDSCAGCATGSKHIDLTKAAFTQLADLNEGILTVQMRIATNPKVWYEELWGPKTSDH